MPSTAEPGQPLTVRELQCLTLRGQGLNAREVADRLFIEKRTVDFHCGNAYVKLEVHNIIQALNALKQQPERR